MSLKPSLKPLTRLKIGIFADDLNRQAMGSALVGQRLVKEYLDAFSNQVELFLIYKETNPPIESLRSLFQRANNLPIKILKLPKFSGFFSYLWFFISCKEKFDVVHWLRPSLHPFFWFLKVFRKTKKIVVTFHGAPESSEVPIYQTFFNRFNRWFIKWFGQHFIDIALVDSRFAVQQVSDYYKISKKKIPYIYLGVDSQYHSFSESEKSSAKRKLINQYNISFPYILSVSRLDPHKNVHRLIEAFFQLKEKHQIPHHLVIVGGRHEPNYSEQVENQIKNSPFGKFVQLAPYIEEGDLPFVYSLADLFAFPSLSEGFGLPVVEAMACGTPVVTSSISVMPEISSGAALLVDPYKTESITEAIHRILNDQILRNDLIQKGITRSKEFSWQKMAFENIQLYKKILNLSDESICGVCLKTGELFYKESYNQYSLWECSLCRAQFWSPMKNPGAEWYEKDERYSFRNLNPLKKPERNHKEFLRDLPCVIARSDATRQSFPKLLDIGMGTGNFLAAAVKNGYEGYGIDFDRDAIKTAQDFFHLQNVYPLSIDESLSKFGKEYFDVATLFEVVEHLENPGEFIDKVKKILKPGGYVAISVPFRGLLDSLKVHDKPPRHLTRWDKESMKSFLKDHGFVINRIKIIPITIPYLITKFHFWFGRFFSFNLVQKTINKASTLISHSDPLTSGEESSKIKLIRFLARAKDYLLFTIPALFFYMYLILVRKNGLGLYVLAQSETRS